MTDREPKIGDVIVPRHVNNRPFAAMSPFCVQVTDRNSIECRYMVATGWWVIVDKKPAEAVDTSEQ